MSRCYPFPPPGYVLNESLIESIKGAKEEVKKDRKHKKKDKKRKERDTETDDRSRKHRSDKRMRKDETSANAGGKKKVDDGLVNGEVEFLEKSCLTMELEQQQTSSSQNSCDSSLHRPKRVQTQSQPLDGRQNDSEIGKRIRLHSKEQKDHEAMMMTDNEDQKQCPRDSIGHLYQTSANEAPREDPNFGMLREITTKLGKEKKTIPLKDVKSRETNRKISTELDKEKMPSSRSHQEQEKPSSSHQEPSKLLCSKRPSSMEVRFLNLIENWVPDRAESKLADSEDQEWWLLVKFGAKRDLYHQVSNQTTSKASSSMAWATARFLPEAELHALPFTVPF